MFAWKRKKKKRWTEEDVREEAKKDRETMKIKKKMNSLGCLWVRKKWEGGRWEDWERERKKFQLKLTKERDEFVLQFFFYIQNSESLTHQCLFFFR